MKKWTMFKTVSVAVSAFLLITAIALTIVNYHPEIEGLKMMWLIGYSTNIEEADKATISASGDALAETIESEGIVLTKNAGNVLPLSYSETKAKGVNVFGWSSTSWVPGGSGSGRVTRKNNNYYAEIGIVNALTHAGIDYNTELYQFYMDYIPALNGSGSGTGDSSQNVGLPLTPGGTTISGNNRPGWRAGNGGTLKAYDFQYSRLIEPDIGTYSTSLKTNAEAYSDTAIVVISRVSGESNDSPKVQYKGNITSNSSSTNAAALAADSVIADPDRHYLEISTEEEDMLKYVGANYDKTIVLINSTNTMELGFMDTIPGLDACLIVGCTGVNAATAIPKVMFDKVPVDSNGNLSPDGQLVDGITPSGKTVATYAYDLKTAASWANSGDSNQSESATTSGTGLSDANAPKVFGQNYYTGVTKAMDLYPFGTNGNSGPSNGNFNGQYRGTGYQGITYMDYSEGIYVGYKWYETADTMGYWDTASAYWNASTYTKKPTGAIGYEAVVQYPLGYGLSYTTFSWDVLKSTPENNVLTSNGSVTVSVNVKNTGDYAGKDVVQLYYEPPYKVGGIEKSSSNLVAYEKTQLLKPGESQVLELKFDVYDMASYDAYNLSGKVPKGGYIVEEGTYIVTVRNDAHTVADTLETVQGKTATISYTVPKDGFVYDKDPITGNPVSNQFTGKTVVAQADYDKVQVDGSDESTPVKYMKRSDIAGTFPTLQPARAITEEVKSVNSYTAAMANDWAARNAAETPTQGSGGSDRVWDAGKIVKAFESTTEDEEALLAEKEKWYAETAGIERTKLTELGYELAQNFDSDKWTALLNQIALNQLTSESKGTGITIMPGTLGEAPISTIGKPATISLDGPNMWSSFASVGKGTGFPQSVVLAQTFNKYLAYCMGLQFGADTKAAGGNGWLGPGINIHRSPLGGRNYEYYSEDAYITGTMCAEAVKGAKNMGVYVYLKHLALYDQESNRDSLHVWVTEQALREIYLKPFRIAILKYESTGHGATGIMTAYGRIGAVWTGGSYPLITGVVRNEWNFNGAVLTDWSDHRYFMNMSHALRAGGDIGINCGWDSKIDSSATFSTGAFQQATRTAAKRIVWTWLQAEYMAANYNPTEDGEIVFIGVFDRVANFDWVTMLVFIYWGIVVVTSGTLILFAFVIKQKQSE